jgi:hypothetical protein
MYGLCLEGTIDCSMDLKIACDLVLYPEQKM